MSFSEKPSLKDERLPLLRDPVLHYNHRYGGGRSYDPEEVDEYLGAQIARTQRFQWILFVSVTVVSIVILLATLGVLIRLSETHPPVIPKDTVTTKPSSIATTPTTTKPIATSPSSTTSAAPPPSSSSPDSPSPTSAPAA